jgi:hypothetical protein
VIPDGVTSQIQPFDTSVNKSFKDYLRNEYEVGLISGNLPLTPSGKIKSTSISKFAELVSAAWRISQEKPWNFGSRSAALKMHLMAHKVTSCGAVVNLTAAI